MIQLTAMLDRTALSSRAAMMIVFETSRAFSYDPQALALNRSTIQRHIRREASAASIKVAFKHMHDLTGIGKVAHSGFDDGDKKVLAIPNIQAGRSQAHAVYSVI